MQKDFPYGEWVGVYSFPYQVDGGFIRPKFSEEDFTGISPPVISVARTPVDLDAGVHEVSTTEVHYFSVCTDTTLPLGRSTADLPGDTLSQRKQRGGDPKFSDDRAFRVPTRGVGELEGGKNPVTRVRVLLIINTYTPTTPG